jgi:hypothetical protein
MEILLQRSKYVQAWYNGFPYADMNDPCERGIQFNVSRPPYDNVDIRWALATDIRAVSMATSQGMLRVSPLQVPPIDILQNTYHKPMVPWLKNFALSDGYKPFEDSFARDITTQLKAEGRQGLPTTPQQEIDVFGVGWFKYVGESGSGKTTLARMFLRLLDAASGDIFIGEIPISSYSRNKKQFYRKVQPIFQNPFTTFSTRRTVDRYLFETALNLQIAKNRTDAVQIISEALHSVGLEYELWSCKSCNSQNREIPFHQRGKPQRRTGRGRKGILESWSRTEGTALHHPPPGEGGRPGGN